MYTTDFKKSVTHPSPPRVLLSVSWTRPSVGTRIGALSSVALALSGNPAFPRTSSCVSWPTKQHNNNWPNYYKRCTHYYYYHCSLLFLLLPLFTTITTTTAVHYYYYFITTIYYGCSARAELTTTAAGPRSVERVERAGGSRARRSVFTVSEFSRRPTAVPVSSACVGFRYVYVSFRFSF